MSADAVVAPSLGLVQVARPLGLLIGPVGGWHPSNVGARLLNAALFAGVGVVLAARFWSSNN